MDRPECCVMLPTGPCPEPGIEFEDITCECGEADCEGTGRAWYCANHWDEINHVCGGDCEDL
jgi:hypothetical protein